MTDSSNQSVSNEEIGSKATRRLRAIRWFTFLIAMAVVGFTVAEGRISAIEVVADPAKLRRLGVSQSD